MRVYELDREGHIARHGVRLEEVDDVVFGDPLVLRTPEGRYNLIGQTAAGHTSSCS